LSHGHQADLREIREFISHGLPLCSGCERATHQQAAQKAVRERARRFRPAWDGSIIEFRSIVDAARCAIEVQSGLAERNAGLPPEKRIEYRVGIHLGDVVEEADGDLMGDGVNIAARLEGLQGPARSASPSKPTARRRSSAQ
jgi:class 3 adenylate cyclase